MISASNEQRQQQLEYTLRKPDCHSWWTSKMQSGCKDTLEERYAIKFCIATGEDYFEGDLSLMCVLSIKVTILKSLETYLMILVHGYWLKKFHIHPREIIRRNE